MNTSVKSYRIVTSIYTTENRELINFQLKTHGRKLEGITITRVKPSDRFCCDHVSHQRVIFTISLSCHIMSGMFSEQRTCRLGKNNLFVQLIISYSLTFSPIVVHLMPQLRWDFCPTSFVSVVVIFYGGQLSLNKGLTCTHCQFRVCEFVGFLIF